MSKKVISLSLEEVIIDRTVALKFIDHLGKSYSLETLTFWLEAQNYKYVRDQKSMDTSAKDIYSRYFGPTGSRINIDETEVLEDLKKMIKMPTRTTFLRVQNSIWGLIKLECFAKFKQSDNLEVKLKGKAMKQIQLTYPMACSLYDQFYENNSKYPIKGGFKANVLPDDFYEEHLRIDVPEVFQLWEDKDLFYAFREFLYQQYAAENLSFYLQLVNYETLAEEDLKQEANAIYAKFISPSAPFLIHIEQPQLNEIKKQILTPTRDSFLKLKQKMMNIIETEWFPNFLASPLYVDCNAETVKFTHTEGPLKRTESTSHFEKLFSLRAV